MKFFQLIPSDTNIDFIGKFKIFLTFSLVTGVAIIFGVATKGLNYGIDFTGGTVMQVKFNKPMPTDQVRDIVEKMGEKEASVVALGDSNQEYLITARNTTAVKTEAPLNKRFTDTVGGANAVSIQSMDVVGPKVGSELKGAALRSLFYTVILITIYIWLRFDARFAPGATIAMIHDLLMTAGFYLLTGREFTITAVAALLTIAGYSVNDTIVIYDRVREMIKKGGEGIPLPQLINKAINVTLSRTLLTALITLISIVPLIFFTTGEIQSFAVAMCFGIFVGCYSTIYIASPFTIYAERFLEKRKGTTTGRTKARPVSAS